MSVLDDSQDAFGRALLDHHEGRSGPELRLEFDDGSSRPADLQPEEFFLPHDAWPWWKQRVMARAAGAVVDLGAGAGRHSLHLQQLGHDVTAVDASPGAVEVCRARGIRDVRLADLTELPADGRWDTFLLMCGNLGIAGDREPTRRLFARLAGMAVPGSVLIGDSVDPGSDDPTVHLRLHYGDLTTPWWDLLNLPPSDMEAVVDGTGWSVEERLIDGEDYAVVLRRG